MKFSEVVAQTLAWLQREERVSYRALKLEFDLNEDVLDALKEELIEAKRVAVDENGKVLVWTGTAAQRLRSRVKSQNKSKVQSPRSKVKKTIPQPLAPSPWPRNAANSR